MTTATEIPKDLIEKISEHRARQVCGTKPRYPRWAREPLLQFFESGMKATAIAAVTGVPADQIYVWARKQRAARRIFKPETFKEIKIAREPEPPAELRVRVGQAEIFGLSVKMLGELLRETGQLSR